MVRRLCIIPARSGSKGYPDKNRAKLFDKSLIVIAVEKASSLFDQVIFSSDSFEYLEEISNLNLSNVICSLRPHDLASDVATLDDVTSYYCKQYRKHFSQIWLLLPTFPILSKDDIQKHQILLDEGKFEAVIALSEIKPSPYFGLEFDSENKLLDWHPSSPRLLKNPLVKETLKKVYTPTGLYGMKMSSFENKGSFFRGNVSGLILSHSHAIDIQSSYDLKYAQIILEEVD